jgi:hypothetical protein
MVGNEETGYIRRCEESFAVLGNRGSIFVVLSIMSKLKIKVKRNYTSDGHSSDSVVQSDYAAASNFYGKKMHKCSLEEPI